MICSINEVRSLLQKAAVGTGYANGLAEEIAGGGAWLCAQGFDGISATLKSMDSEAPGSISTEGTSEGLIISSARVGNCGPSTLDLLSSGTQSNVILLQCDAPLLLLGMAGVAAEARDLEYRFNFANGAKAIVSKIGASMSGPLSAGSDVAVSCRKPSESAEPPPRPLGVEVQKESWEQASALAARTYVPATESSRLKGAGAGLTDND